MFSHLQYTAKKNKRRLKLPKSEIKSIIEIQIITEEHSTNCTLKKLSNLHKMSKILRKQKLTKEKI